MEKLIDDLDPSNIWKTVRAMIPAARTFLRGWDVEKYLRGAQMRLKAAENKVREQLALMALRMELAPPALRPDAKPPEKPKPKTRAQKRSFAVMPPSGLRSLQFEYLAGPVPGFSVPWLDTNLASFEARVDVLEAVMDAPARHARRLARIMQARDAIGVSLRFFGAGIRLPIEQVRKFLPPTQPVPINDSS